MEPAISYQKLRNFILGNPYRSGLFVVSFIFTIFNAYIDYMGFFSNYIQALGIANVFFFFAYALAFFAKRDRISEGVMKAAFALAVANFILSIILLSALGGTTLRGIARDMFILLAVFIALIPIFLCGSLAILMGRRHRLASSLFALLAIACIAVFAYFIIYPHNVAQDDEMVIAGFASNALLHGSNPYAVNASSWLYANRQIENITVTVTASNQVVGEFSYPALYLIVTFPFYLLTNVIHNVAVTWIGMPVAAFFLILIAVIMFYAERNFYKKPGFAAIFFIPLLITFLASPINLLMLALVVLAYVKLESRYSWVLLGLCASLQQLLWVPVILMIAYSANNEGLKRGLYNALGAAAVFLILDSWFILAGSHAFISNILSPTGGNILPNPVEPFGYLITVTYGTAISIDTVLLAIVALAAVLLLFYFNDKRIIGILSMLPFLFMSHGIALYGIIFISFFFITMEIREKRVKEYGIFGYWLHSAGYRLVVLIVVLALLGAFMAARSHAAYEAEFAPSVSITGSSFNTSSYTESYSTVIHYPNSTGKDPSIVIYTNGNDNYAILGLFNNSITENPVLCPPEDYGCMVNINRVALLPGREDYSVDLNATLYPNETIREARIAIYNGNYFYTSGVV